MSNKQNEDTADLIKELLNRKDPAIVGLKKILRQKSDVVGDQSFKNHAPTVFNAPTSKKAESNESMFSDSDKRVLEVEELLLERDKEIKELNDKIESEKISAYEAGVEDGKVAALENSREEIDKIGEKQATEFMEKLTGIIENELTARNLFFSSADKDLVDLAFILAKKIIGQEISINREIVINSVKKALTFISSKTDIIIYVSPNDRDYVNGKLKEFNDRHDDMISATVVERDSIEDGGTVIESDSGIVDSRISVQLNELQDIIDQSWDEFSQGTGDNNDYETAI